MLAALLGAAPVLGLGALVAAVEHLALAAHHVLQGTHLLLAALALLLALGLRAAVTWRAREPWWTVPLHPLTVLVALAIQWTALARWALGLPPGWKGRAYPGTKAA